MRSSLGILNLALRGVMEIGIIIALAYWGYQAGNSRLSTIGMAILLPLVGFVFWGLVDFRKTGSLAEVLRLIQELAISGIAAWALFTADAPIPGMSLAVISIVHHILVYALGGTLLKHG